MDVYPTFMIKLMGMGGPKLQTLTMSEKKKEKIIVVVQIYQPI